MTAKRLYHLISKATAFLIFWATRGQRFEALFADNLPAERYREKKGRLIRFYKIGGLLRFDEKDVAEFLERNRVESFVDFKRKFD